MKYCTPIIPFGNISLNSSSMSVNDKNKAMVTLCFLVCPIAHIDFIIIKHLQKCKSATNKACEPQKCFLVQNTSKLVLSFASKLSFVFWCLEIGESILTITCFMQS